MNKRKTKKAAYIAIVKDSKTHQETFDVLRKKTSMDTGALATEVSKIPSRDKQESQQVLRFVFIGILVVIIALRILGLIAISQELDFNPSILLVVIVIGLIVPVMGIIGSLTSRIEFYRTVGVLFILSTIRSFSRGEMVAETIDLIVLIPFAIAVGLAFFIPFKLKTDFTTKSTKKEVDGKSRTYVEYVFDTKKMVSDENLLDDDI